MIHADKRLPLGRKGFVGNQSPVASLSYPLGYKVAQDFYGMGEGGDRGFGCGL